MTTPLVGVTAAVEATEALFARLAEEAGSGRLGDVAVSPEVPMPLPLRCLYGGGWRSDIADAVAEPGLMHTELVTVGLYVRVVARPVAPRIEVERDAARIAGLVGTVLRANPRLAGNLTWVGLGAAQGDYSRTDMETVVVHAYQARVRAYSVWG